MAYQPKSYKKFVATAATATLVASAIAPVAFADSSKFTDVSAKYKDAVDFVVSKGANGLTATSFGVDANIKRVDAAVLLVNVLGLDIESAPASGLTDVPQRAVKHINALKEAGITSGKTPTTFDPDAQITRGELAIWISKAFKLEGSNTTPFKDVSSNYTTAVSALVAAGITQGTSETTFGTTANAKRGDYAIFLQRAAQGGVGTPAELAITSVTSLDASNKFIEITFSQAVTGLEASDITVQHKDSLSRYGIKEVKVSANGKTATVELFAKEDAENVLIANQEYLVKVFANGQNLETTFIRPDWDKGRVINVDAKDRTVTVAGTKGTKNLNIPTTVEFDFYGALGKEANVWFNKDRDLLEFNYVTETIFETAVEVTKARDEEKDVDGEVKLLDSGKKYDLAEDFEFYLNDDDSKELGAKGIKYSFAKVVLDKSGDVEKIFAYDLDESILVNKVEGNIVVDFDENEEDLKDYLIVKDGKQVSISDLKQNDLVFFNEDAEEDGIAIVLNKTVTGKIENVFEDSFEIDGKTYDYDNDSGTVQYLNDDEYEDLYSKAAEKLQAGGDVTVYINWKGDAVLVKGTEGQVEEDYADVYTTDAIVAYKDAKGNARIELTVADKDGKEKLYDFAVDSLDEIVVQDVNDEYEWEVNEKVPGKDEEIEEFGLTDFETEGKSTDDAFSFVALDEDEKNIGEVFKITETQYLFGIATDDDGKVVGLKFYKAQGITTADLEAKDGYAKVDNKSYKVSDSTIVFDVDVESGYPDADDVEVKTLGDLRKSGTDIKEGATIYFNEKGDVTHIVTKDLKAAETTEQTAVLQRIDRNTDKEIVRVVALVNGKSQTLKVVDKDKNQGLEEGSVVVLDINDTNGEVEDITLDTNRLVYGKIIDINVSKKEVKLSDGETYKLDSDGAVYDATDADGDDYTVEAMRDLEKGDPIVVALSAAGSLYADAFVLVKDLTKYGNKKPEARTVETEVNEGGSITVTVSELADDADTLKIDSIEKQGTSTTATVSADGLELVIKADKEIATDSTETITVKVTDIHDASALVDVKVTVVAVETVIDAALEKVPAELELEAGTDNNADNVKAAIQKIKDINLSGLTVTVTPVQDKAGEYTVEIESKGTKDSKVVKVTVAE